MIGRYMAAARGPKNAAAKGGANTKSLRSGTGSSGTTQQQSSGSAARRATTPKGSMEGFEGGKSTYIQPRGAGYGHNTSPVSMPSTQRSARPGSADLRRGTPRVDVTDLRRVQPMSSPTSR